MLAAHQFPEEEDEPLVKQIFGKKMFRTKNTGDNQSLLQSNLIKSGFTKQQSAAAMELWPQLDLENLWSTPISSKGVETPKTVVGKKGLKSTKRNKEETQY